MNIYVGNLDYNINENELNNMFSEFGTVTSSKIITDRETGRAKGFGFVEMSDDNEANQAIEALNGKAFNNRNIKVNESLPKKRTNNY